MKIYQKYPLYLAIIVVASIITIPVFGAQNMVTDSNIQITMSYPDIVKQGDSFVLSTVTKVTADQVSNITLSISSSELDMPQDQFKIEKLAKDSTIGNDFKPTVKHDTPDGMFAANVQVEYFIKGYFDAQPVKHAITQAIQFDVESKPSLVFEIQAPDNIFAGEPFSVKGTVKNKGIDAQNITLSISGSKIDLEGKKTISISNLNSGEMTNFEFLIQTPKDIGVPVNDVVHINGQYADDTGKKYSSDTTLNIFARQRGMLEIGDANGIWVGNFFIAPVVGLGTIVGSFIGFMIFLWHFRNKRREKKAKRKTKQ